VDGQDQGGDRLMSAIEEAAAEQIVVVRRRAGGEDEHHHGGVWKIAYADFMTAMMAFFLVMWLINAANTETKASVASYFNPIKLTDTLAHRKGLRKPDDKPDVGDKPAPRKGEAMEGAKGGGERPGPAGAEAGNEPAPQGRSIADSRGPAAAKVEHDAAPAAGVAAGRAFRDPFNPLGTPGQTAAGEAAASKGEARPTAPTNGAASELKPQAATVPATEQGMSIAGPPAASSGERHAAGGDAQRLSKAAEAVRRQAEAAARQIGVSGGPGIDVTIEGDSIVLSLTDTSTFGMFAVGSAEPSAETVRLLHSIAPIVAAHSETVLVRGHTDGRPYRADARNNNWRLAMARAETAHAVLVRAGIDDARFERIEAHADRKLRVANDPTAAANRRIEIVLARRAR
jgi:chemotaxis protein MotB